MNGTKLLRGAGGMHCTKVYFGVYFKINPVDEWHNRCMFGENRINELLKL